MSEDAMKNAQLEHCKQENVQMKAALTNFSGQIRALRTCVDELLNANIALRTNQIIIEDSSKQLEEKCKLFEERINCLEKENKELKSEFDLVRTLDGQAA